MSHHRVYHVDDKIAIPSTVIAPPVPQTPPARSRYRICGMLLRRARDIHVPGTSNQYILIDLGLYIDSTMEPTDYNTLTVVKHAFGDRAAATKDWGARVKDDVPVQSTGISA